MGRETFPYMLQGAFVNGIKRMTTIVLLSMNPLATPLSFAPSFFTLPFTPENANTPSIRMLFALSSGLYTSFFLAFEPFLCRNTPFLELIERRQGSY